MAEIPKETAPSGEAVKSSQGNPAPSLSVLGVPTDYLDLKAEAQHAVMTIKGAVAASGHTLTREAVIKKLQEGGVVYGMDWAVIDKMIAEKQYDRGVIIASGLLPKPSKDAYITEKIKIDPDVKPVLGKDGKADYKNVDNIHQVKKGDVLAVKMPMYLGESGQDIYGKAMPTLPAKDVQFKLGTNTEVAPDGLSLVAATGGYVFHQGGIINVGVTYVLKGNVDFHTGNLRYTGDIQILGNVTTGFTVEAEGNITVEGNVDAADVISRNGSVTIKSAVFGHGTGKVSAKHNIQLLVAQDLTIACEEGVLAVEKSLRNCNVTAPAVKADKPGCSVVGGIIKAYGEVSLALMGAEGCRTEVQIVDKEGELAKIRIKEIDKLTAQLDAKLDPIATRLKGMMAMATKMGRELSERSRAELKGVLEAYNLLIKAVNDLATEREKLTAVTKAAQNHGGKFQVTEKIVWGGFVDIYGHTRELTAEDVRKEWIWAPDGLLGRMLMTEEPKPSDPRPPG